MRLPHVALPTGGNHGPRAMAVLPKRNQPQGLKPLCCEGAWRGPGRPALPRHLSAASLDQGSLLRFRFYKGAEALLLRPCPHGSRSVFYNADTDTLIATSDAADNPVEEWPF